MFRLQYVLALFQISSVPLADSYGIFQQITGRNQERGRQRRTPSPPSDGENERDLRSFTVASQEPSNHDCVIDDLVVPSNEFGDDTMASTVLERKSFVELVAATSGAVFGIQPARGTTMDPKTGIRLPDPGEIESAIPSNWKDEENPVSSPGTETGSGGSSNTQFARLDNKPDSVFYQDPRFVEHVDENAVKLITEYISKTAIRQGRDTAVLDLCSSWTSHIDEDVARKMTRIAGLGMNAKELDRNSALTDWIVQDLNENPQLAKYENGSFDVVLCQLSIDYLTKPLQVLKEVGRILKVGGQVHIIFSNRLFLTKAVGLWTGGDDIDHAYYVGSYLHFCDGGFEDIRAIDLSNRKGGRDKLAIGDPVFVVSATKQKA
mmetsp:Transcript_2261/g.6047  ORF Transcript_2261/g.6047 Transcript_2261/m.6047 type:complete len:377 (-) Transcript_2261:102-1232(-)